MTTKTEKITEVIFAGYFPKEICEKLKEKLSGQTYMQFEISYSDYCGNCNLCVSTRRQRTSKKELKEHFIFHALWKLAEA